MPSGKSMVLICATATDRISVRRLAAAHCAATRRSVSASAWSCAAVGYAGWSSIRGLHHRASLPHQPQHGTGLRQPLALAGTPHRDAEPCVGKAGLADQVVGASGVAD